MNRRRPRGHRFAQRSFAAAGLLLGMTAAHAGTVTVDVANIAAQPAADTIVMFEPKVPVPPGTPRNAVVDQINKRFVPRVTAVQQGASVGFPNADHIRHQVFSFSDTKKFSLKLYAGSPRADVRFDKPGLVVLGCNIHDTMVAFVGVVDTPYFATTTNTGVVKLDLPPGEYQLRVWNPTMRAPFSPQHVTVTAAPIDIPLRLDLSGSSDAVAAWPE